MGGASYSFGIWRLAKRGPSGQYPAPADYPFTPLEITEAGISWTDSRTTKSGILGWKSETVTEPRRVQLSDLRDAKCSWSPRSASGYPYEYDTYYLTFKTAQGDEVILALATGSSEISRDQLREAVGVLRTYGVNVDDPNDLL